MEKEGPSPHKTLLFEESLFEDVDVNVNAKCFSNNDKCKKKGVVVVG